jgi:hypothetical protein
MRPGAPVESCYGQVGLRNRLTVTGAASEDDDAIENLKQFFFLAGDHYC